MNKNTTTIQKLKREYSAPMMCIVQLESGTHCTPLAGSIRIYKDEEVEENPDPEDEDLRDIWGTQW